jgi:hypothetical protein
VHNIAIKKRTYDFLRPVFVFGLTINLPKMAKKLTHCAEVLYNAIMHNHPNWAMHYALCNFWLIWLGTMLVSQNFHAF